MHKPYLLWERMEKIQEDTLCGLLLGWCFLGVLPHPEWKQDRIFSSSIREGRMLILRKLRTVSLKVKFSVQSTSHAVAAHIRAVGHNLELLLKLSESGLRAEQQKRFLSYTFHKLHLSFIFCPQIVLNKHEVGLVIIIFFFYIVYQKHSS